MEEKNEKQKIEESKDFLESLLDKENVSGVLKDFFANNTANVKYFCKAAILMVEEETARVKQINEQDHESHLIYIRALESHLKFLEGLREKEAVDANAIEQKILKIIDEMKEERDKQRDFKKHQQEEDRKELTKRMAIGAALAGVGVFAVSMVINKGNPVKSAEQTAEIVQQFIGSPFK